MSGLVSWWRDSDRRRLPEGTSTPLYVSLALVLLAALGWTLWRDVAYLRTIPIDDIFAYECYARAFWRGGAAVVDAPHMRLCANAAFRFWVARPRAFHTFPREYPAPALSIFSLPLLAPLAPYNLTWMALMAGLIVAVTVWLARAGLLPCAGAFALYVVLGGWGTALARFDLVPGLLILAALALAERRRWAWAYLGLAAATALKFSPVLLVPVLAVHQWRATGRPPWRGPTLFALATSGALLPAALIDPTGFRQPFRYNLARPPQVESLPGSALWLLGRVGMGGRVRTVLTYHSLNFVGAFAGVTTALATLLLVGGLLLALWRAGRGHDGLGRSFVLVVLVTLAGSKLLSPQYLLWLFPVAAYVEGPRLRWTALAALTVAIFPRAYQMFGLHASLVTLPDHPPFMTAILARNAVLLAFTLAYLGARAARKHAVGAPAP